MSFLITYHRLAEINLLHGFYLDRDGSPFSGLSATDRASRLQDLLSRSLYDLSPEIGIVPTAATRKVMAGHRIVYRQTPAGLLLGMAVNTVTANNATHYDPVCKPADGLRLQFHLYLKSASLAARSSLRLRPSLPAQYYFTNDTTVTNKVYPSLSAPTVAFQAGRRYEMGETAIVNGSLSRAVQNTTSAASGWSALTTDNNVSEYDRVLLPFAFNYFIDQPDITDLQCVLQQNGNTLQTLHFNNAAGLHEVSLDLSKAADNSKVAPGFYTLVVSGNNNFEGTYDIYLQPALYEPGAWGVLDLVLKNGDADFTLLDANNFLATRNTSPDYPVFELRFPSRATYWKYYFQQDGPADADPNWDVLPATTGTSKIIISKEPFPLMSTYRKVLYANSRLPNPQNWMLSTEADKICSDILLTKIKL